MAEKKKKDDNNDARISNKKAYHNFELVEKFEAGMGLLGTEVKSLRAGLADLNGSYARFDNSGECWLVGASINQYDKASYANHEPLRKRKLLLHRAELKKIRIKLEQRGFTLVPLKIYFNSRGLAKIELALAKGKKQFDKRQNLVAKQQKRDVDRSMKNYRK
ncbi:MAG TPA: SsrA-binding protein SmpB [Sedimentisphaerales bacterium]|nr:SsrA-binding protein SmpB [Sedimentisphaerales bacterium]